jgi:hypothetical protein
MNERNPVKLDGVGRRGLERPHRYRGRRRQIRAEGQNLKDQGRFLFSDRTQLIPYDPALRRHLQSTQHLAICGGLKRVLKTRSRRISLPHANEPREARHVNPAVAARLIRLDTPPRTSVAATVTEILNAVQFMIVSLSTQQ